MKNNRNKQQEHLQDKILEKLQEIFQKKKKTIGKLWEQFHHKTKG